MTSNLTRQQHSALKKQPASVKVVEYIDGLGPVILRPNGSTRLVTRYGTLINPGRARKSRTL